MQHSRSASPALREQTQHGEQEREQGHDGESCDNRLPDADGLDRATAGVGRPPGTLRPSTKTVDVLHNG